MARRTNLNKLRTEARPCEMIGGGFIIFRRGRTYGRVWPEAKGTNIETFLPFEYPTKEAATETADQLAVKYPSREFVVFEQIYRTKK